MRYSWLIGALSKVELLSWHFQLSVISLKLACINYLMILDQVEKEWKQFSLLMQIPLLIMVFYVMAIPLPALSLVAAFSVRGWAIKVALSVKWGNTNICMGLLTKLVTFLSSQDPLALMSCEKL